MNKMCIEFKKWYQEYSQSQERAGGLMAGHVLSGDWVRRCTVLRCGQFFGAVLFAGGLSLLNLWSGGGVLVLVAWSATSALVYLGLAMQSRTGTLALLNLFAVPILFVTAYAGMSVTSGWLIISFMLHGCVTAVQLSSIDKDLVGWLFCWSVFSSAMAVFLLLG